VPLIPQGKVGTVLILSNQRKKRLLIQNFRSTTAVFCLDRAIMPPAELADGSTTAADSSSAQSAMPSDQGRSWREHFPDAQLSLEPLLLVFLPS
jgi:hypothetical protein